VDVLRESDVIEEILRIYGYNNIEIPSSVKMSVAYSDKVDKEKIYNTVADYLSSNGFHETINNSLTKAEYYTNNKDFEKSNCVQILNPLSKELDVMRQTLLYGGLETIAYNQNRQTPEVRIFEFGKSYHFHSSEKTHEKKYEEKEHLVILISGKKLPENWVNKDASSDVFLLKAYVDSIIQKTGFDFKKMTMQKSKAIYYEDGIEYYINKIKICEFGLINKLTLSFVDVKQKVYFADINWDEIIRLFALKPVSYKEVSKYPEVRRDLALLLDKKISFNEIENLAYEIEKENLVNLGLFDVYEGEKIEAGKKSYAISFVLQDKFATLTDKKIEKIMNKLIKGFQEKLNAVIR